MWLLPAPPTPVSVGVVAPPLPIPRVGWCATCPRSLPSPSPPPLPQWYWNRAPGSHGKYACGCAGSLPPLRVGVVVVAPPSPFSLGGGFSLPSPPVCVDVPYTLHVCVCNPDPGARGNMTIFPVLCGGGGRGEGRRVGA